jgi:hypothetical protein
MGMRYCHSTRILPEHTSGLNNAKGCVLAAASMAAQYRARSFPPKPPTVTATPLPHAVTVRRILRPRPVRRPDSGSGGWSCPLGHAAQGVEAAQPARFGRAVPRMRCSCPRQADGEVHITRRCTGPQAERGGREPFPPIALPVPAGLPEMTPVPLASPEGSGTDRPTGQILREYPQNDSGCARTMYA